MDIDDDDDDEFFGSRDLIELIKLGAYLEAKAERRLFPRARFERYSEALDRLIMFLAHEFIGSEPLGETADSFRKLLELKPYREPATILTHPRFRGRRKPGPSPGGSGPSDAA